VAGSDLLGITATSSSPRVAHRLANAFANATIQQRTGQLHAQVERLITELTPLMRRQRGARADPVDPSQRMLPVRLQQLEALRVASDPTVRFEIPATRPRDPSSPKPALSTAVSLLAGLLTGLGVVFGMQLIDPRIRSERHLRELYRLPVLARVPEVRGLFGRTRRSAATEARNSYQALRVALIGGGAYSEPGRSIMLTGPSRRDGKTTTAIGLARALVQTGQRTTLVEADARSPSIGRAMGISSNTGLHDVMREVTPLSEALLHTEIEALNVLLVEHPGAWLPDLLLPETANRLLSELQQTSEWIVIDCAPLGRVIDPLPLAILANQLLLVVRLGKSKVGDLRRLADVVDQYGIRATGFVLIGSKQPRYYG
jgi:Mrp family chromosome partitioning ATPase